MLLPPLQWDQAYLPISMGGLGLRRAEKHGSAAYLASVGDSAEDGEVAGGAKGHRNSHLRKPLTDPRRGKCSEAVRSFTHD